MAESPNRPRRLTVASSKGGVAKSTTCRNLGVVAARAGLKVALVDTDLQRTLTRWHDRRPDNAADITLVTALLTDIDDIAALGGFDVMIIDTPPLVTDGITDEDEKNKLRKLRKLVSVSDFIIVPSGQQDEDLSSAESWMDFLKMCNSQYSALLTATSRRSKSFETAKKRLVKGGYPLCPIDIPRVEDIPFSHSHGIGVAEMKRGKGAEEYEAVWSYVSGQLGI